MSIIVDKDKYLYYKNCEKSLRKILDIMKDEEFQSYYEPILSHKDTIKIWDYYIIDIYSYASIVKINKGEKENESNV
tara:strand:- start:435 stop:665 length:231 start_codon:yes stop_codon:yes gene_type:complete